MIVSSIFSKRILVVGVATIVASAPLHAEPIKAVLQAPETTISTAPMAQPAIGAVQADVDFSKPSTQRMGEDVIDQLRLRLDSIDVPNPVDQVTDTERLRSPVASR